MNTKTIIIIAVALLVIILVIFFVVNKSKKAASVSDTRPTASAGVVADATGTASSKPCVPYTQAQYDRDIKNCRNKCQPKLLLPIVGVGAYSKCMNACKQGLPFVQDCLS